MGHIIFWVIVGGAAGILAKGLVPGNKNEPKGCLPTILLGIAGSLGVGFVMRSMFGNSGLGGLVPTTVGATIGAVVILLLLKNFWSRKR